MGIMRSYRPLSVVIAGLIVASSVLLGYWLMTEGTPLQRIFGIAILLSALFLTIHYYSLVERTLVNG